MLWMQWSFVYDDGLMATLVGTRQGASTRGWRQGSYFPDGLWVFEDTESGYEGCLAIEVGEYNPDRAPGDVPVLHIGFGGKVSLIKGFQQLWNRE